MAVTFVCGRGHASRRFPKITPDKRQQFLASTLELTPAPQGHSPLRSALWHPLLILFGATAALLGLACMNVAGLFLARGSARGREIHTRLALGASRGRIGSQLLADSLLIAVLDPSSPDNSPQVGLWEFTVQNRLLGLEIFKAKRQPFGGMRCRSVEGGKPCGNRFCFCYLMAAI